jgi:hypothetical protein
MLELKTEEAGINLEEIKTNKSIDWRSINRSAIETRTKYKLRSAEKDSSGNYLLIIGGQNIWTSQDSAFRLENSDKAINDLCDYIVQNADSISRIVVCNERNHINKYSFSTSWIFEDEYMDLDPTNPSSWPLINSKEINDKFTPNCSVSAQELYVKEIEKEAKYKGLQLFPPFAISGSSDVSLNNRLMACIYWHSVLRQTNQQSPLIISKSEAQNVDQYSAFSDLLNKEHNGSTKKQITEQAASLIVSGFPRSFVISTIKDISENMDATKITFVDNCCIDIGINWLNQTTQEELEKLKNDGLTII